MKICVYAGVRDPDLLSKVAFYSDDIQIIRELGHDVTVARSIREVPASTDLFYCWLYARCAEAIGVAKLLRKPVILVGGVHLQDPEDGFYTKPRLKQLMARICIRAADSVIAVSNSECDGLSRLGARTISTLHHCVRGPGRRTLRSARQPVILTLGHLNASSIRRKRFLNVIRAIPSVLARVPDARFVIAGHHENGFEELPRTAAELGVSAAVSFPGLVENEERERLYQTSMVLAQPTIFEGFGLVQAETMARGLPVVTCPRGAVPEVVGDTGLYCDPDSVSELADNILRLLTDSEAWERCSLSGFNRANELFDYRTRMRGIEQLIERVSASKKSRLFESRRPADNAETIRT